MNDEIEVGDFVIVKYGGRVKNTHIGIVKEIYSSGYLVDLITCGRVFFKASEVRKATDDEINKFLLR